MAHLRDPKFLNLTVVSWVQGLLWLGSIILVPGTPALETVGIPVTWDSPRARAPASSTTEARLREVWGPGAFQRAPGRFN